MSRLNFSFRGPVCSQHVSMLQRAAREATLESLQTLETTVRKILSVTCAVLLAAVIPVIDTPVLASASAESCPSEDVEAVAIDEVERTTDCDIVGLVATYEGQSLVIPEEGDTVGVEAIYVDGTQSLEITTNESGDVEVSIDPRGEVESGQTTTPEGGGGGADGCQDEFYDPPTRRNTQAITYRLTSYGTDVIPGVGDEDGALAQMDSNLGGANDCGYSDTVSLELNKVGAVPRTSGITNSGNESHCDSTDGYNIVDSGNLEDHGHPPLAVTCWRVFDLPSIDDTREFDIRFNTTNFQWTNSPNSSCNGKYDFSSVAIHELGHAAGLKHVSETFHSKETMSTATASCDDTARSLAAGDILALRSIY